MCGIIGLVSNKEVSSKLLEGLKRLEYRGYDSSGIATIDSGRIQRVRSKGNLSFFRRKALKYNFTWKYWYWSYSLGYSWNTRRKKCSSSYYQ